MARKVPLSNATHRSHLSMCFRQKNIFVSQPNTFSHRVRVRVANNFYSSHSFRVIFTSFEVVFDLQSSFTTDKEKNKRLNRVFLERKRKEKKRCKSKRTTKKEYLNNVRFKNSAKQSEKVFDIESFGWRMIQLLVTEID